MTFVNTNKPQDQIVALLAAHPLFKNLPCTVANQVGCDALFYRYKPRSTIFFEGDPAGHCLLVQSGEVEVLRVNDAGEERVFGRFVRGQLVAEVAMFMPHGRYPMHARAHGQGETSLWRLSRSASELHPVFALRLLENFSLRLYAQVNEIDRLATTSAAQRLAAYLLEQVQKSGATLLLPTSQRQLAAYLGIRAETLNRLFAEWQQRGWLCGERRCWQVCNAKQLRGIAGASVRHF